MNSTPDFLLDKEIEPIDDSALGNLKTACDTHKKLSAEIAEDEAELKAKKAILKNVEQETIPHLLLTHGLSRIKLASGEEVTIKEDISVTVSNFVGFMAWLKKRNEMDIVKIQVAFDKMPEAKAERLFDFLGEHEYMYDSKRDVHAQTKKKYFRTLLGVGQPDKEQGILTARYQRKEAIEHFAKIFTFWHTKIK